MTVVCTSNLERLNAVAPQAREFRDAHPASGRPLAYTGQRNSRVWAGIRTMTTQQASQEGVHHGSKAHPFFHASFQERIIPEGHCRSGCGSRHRCYLDTGLGRELIADALADAFLDAIERSRWRPLERVQLAFRWLEDVARSPPGLELLSEQGDCHSGIFIIVRNRPLYQLAVRHARNARQHTHHSEADRRPELFDEHPDWDETYPFIR